MNPIALFTNLPSGLQIGPLIGFGAKRARCSTREAATISLIETLEIRVCPSGTPMFDATTGSLRVDYLPADTDSIVVNSVANPGGGPLWLHVQMSGPGGVSDWSDGTLTSEVRFITIVPDDSDDDDSAAFLNITINCFAVDPVNGFISELSGPGGGINLNLSGWRGNDTIFGSPANRNLIRGREGNDTLVGGSRRDSIIGGQGNDSLQGATGLSVGDEMDGDDGDGSGKGVRNRL